jgi:nicotinate-nucleotide adenylyltransferase
MAGLTDETYRVGVFGGTFDPPHNAHLVLADEARYQLSLDIVLWLLTPNPPHKKGWDLTPTELRLTMLKAAIGDNPRFSVSKLDITRPAPQFAVDTMLLLRKTYPGSQIYYLMGGDSLQDLPNWERPIEFLNQIDGLGVMRRPGDDINLEALKIHLPGIAERIIYVNAPLMGISSREIRRRINLGLPYRYLIPEPIFKIIYKMHLYRE